MTTFPRPNFLPVRSSLLGRVSCSADTVEFGLSFESAFLPAFESQLADISNGELKLPSSAVSGLAWSPDGTQLLLNFSVPSGDRVYTAAGTFVVHTEPLSLSPGDLLDVRLSPQEPLQCQGASAFWPKGTCVVAVGLPKGRDLLAHGLECSSGLAFHR